MARGSSFWSEAPSDGSKDARSKLGFGVVYRVGPWWNRVSEKVGLSTRASKDYSFGLDGVE